MLGAIAASVPALVSASPALAAYGDSANVFGKVTNTSGFVPYAGENFSVLLPAKWNPSKEREFPGIVLRCALPTLWLAQSDPPPTLWPRAFAPRQVSSCAERQRERSNREARCAQVRGQL